MPTKDSFGNILQEGPFYKYDSTSGQMVLDPEADPLTAFQTEGNYANWVKQPNGTFGPAVLNPGLQSDPSRALNYDPQKGLMSTTVEGKKSWMSPFGAGTGVGSKGGGPVGSRSGGLIHEGAQWNPDTGEWEHPINWGNIMAMGIGGAIAAPFVAGALGAGAAGAGGEAGATGAGVGAGEAGATTGLAGSGFGTGAGLGYTAAPTIADIAGAGAAGGAGASTAGGGLSHIGTGAFEKAGINAGINAAEGKSPGQIALGAGEGLVGGELGALTGAGTAGQAAINAGVGAGAGAATGQTPGQIALGAGESLGGAALGNATSGLSPLERAAISQGAGYGKQQLGKAMAGPTTSGLTPEQIAAISADPNTDPGLASTLAQIAAGLPPVGAALGSAASAKGNTQRANIDTNVGAQNAYNAGLISRAQLEDTQRANAAKDVARQSFLTNFTGGANVNVGGQTGLTPMSDLERATLGNLANQGAASLAKAPKYSAADMAPLVNYTGAANETGVSPLGNALSVASPLMSIGGQLARYLPKIGGAGGGRSQDSTTPATGGTPGADNAVDAQGNAYYDPARDPNNPAYGVPSTNIPSGYDEPPVDDTSGDSGGDSGDGSY